MHHRSPHRASPSPRAAAAADAAHAVCKTVSAPSTLLVSQLVGPDRQVPFSKASAGGSVPAQQSSQGQAQLSTRQLVGQAQSLDSQSLSWKSRKARTGVAAAEQVGTGRGAEQANAQPSAKAAAAGGLSQGQPHAAKLAGQGGLKVKIAFPRKAQQASGAPASPLADAHACRYPMLQSLRHMHHMHVCR